MSATTRVTAAASHWGAALNCRAMSRPPLSGRTVHLKRLPAEVFGSSTSRSPRLRYGDTNLGGRRPPAELRQPSVDRNLHIALEGAGDGAVLLRVLRGRLEFRRVGAWNLAAHVERAGDDGPAVPDFVEGHLRAHLEPLRRRACAREAGRERHREARGVRRGEELLGARLATGRFGA